jgi:hypothetical protein
MAPPFPPERVRLARWIAFAADILQVALLPAVLAGPIGEGIILALDVAVAVTMCVLLRPHWAFAPTFVAEAFPVVDVVPMWWMAVMFVTRDQPAPGAPLPPGTPGAPDAPAPPATTSHDVPKGEDGKR